MQNNRKPSNPSPEEQDNLDQRLASLGLWHNQRYNEAKALLAEGANPDSLRIGMGDGLLHRSVMSLDTKMITILLDAGADIQFRTKDGHSVMHMLWNSRAMFTGDWYKTLSMLEERGCRDPLFKKPQDMTLDEMRRPVDARKKTSFLHLFAINHRFDFVLEALKRDPSARLTADDFCSKDNDNNSLINIMENRSHLLDIFTTEVWQGRRDEMCRVWKQIQYPSEKQQKRFDAAEQEVIDYQQKLLKERVKHSKTTLKKGIRP